MRISDWSSDVCSSDLEVATLVDKTEQFSEAFAAGNDDAARDMYADARVHWERIEPIAESFGDLDPLLDLRAADLGPDQTRSEERRVGQECVSTCKSRWWPAH